MGVRRIACGIEVVEDADTGKRKVPATTAEFLKPPTAREGPRREADLCDKFVTCQHGGERPKEETAHRHRPAAGWPNDREFGIACDGNARHFSSWISMR